MCDYVEMHKTALSEYLKKHGLSDASFAKQIGTDRSSVWRYRTKRQRPEWRNLLAIYKITNGSIEPNDFLREAASQPEATGRD